MITTLIITKKKHTNYVYCDTSCRIQKYFKNGGHSPEKIMTLNDFKTVNGIKLPTAYKTYMLDENEEKGAYVTDIKVSDIQFLPTLKKEAFNRPVKGTTIIGL